MNAAHIFSHSVEALESQRQALIGLLDGAVISSEVALSEVVITVARDQIASVLQKLRDFADYQQLVDITAVDWLSRLPRFDVVYNLLSLNKNERVRIKLGAEEQELVPTVTGVYPTADWFEREVFDMYGLLFDGHPDLRRILTDYGFEGHPLRKDFPLTGYVEVRYDTQARRVVYEPVQLQQDFRNFDFTSPWEGVTTVMQLPGDEKASTVVPYAPPVMPRPSQPNPSTVQPTGFDAAKVETGSEGK